MNRLSIKNLGFALGLTGALLYMGCAVVMITAGHHGAILFFNSLLHGIDVSSILRMDMPIWEACIGIIETFVLGWLVGACIAMFYNYSFTTNGQI